MPTCIGQHTACILASAAKFFVGRRDRVRNAVLNLHSLGRAAGDVQQVAEKRRRPTFALPKVTHQQARKGRQPRAALPGGHALRQVSAGRDHAGTGAGYLRLIFFSGRLLPFLPPVVDEDRQSVGFADSVGRG